MRVPAARVALPPEDRARVLALVDRSLETGSLTLGPNGEEFETEFAARHDAAHAVATSSGTSALEIILRAIEVEGAHVVVPANTFFATAAAVIHAGGRPRFADADIATLAVSRATVEAALTPATTTVVVVHIGGTVCRDIEAIAELCAERDLTLVEDAAHAHGARWQGRSAGTFGRAAAFSFYPTKVVASAEGGMIVTADEALADEARIYRDQGKASFLGGGHVRMGSAWRMSELHAAVGLVSLRRLDDAIGVRRSVAERYDRALADIGGVTVLTEPAESHRNVYKYPLLLDAGIDRARLRSLLALRHAVMLSGEVYATPLHREPILVDLADRALPGAEAVCARHVCLPVHSDMTDAEVAAVVDAVTSVLDEMAPG